MEECKSDEPLGGRGQPLPVKHLNLQTIPLWPKIWQCIGAGGCAAKCMPFWVHASLHCSLSCQHDQQIPGSNTHQVL